MLLVYVVGEPGAGKTTLLGAALAVGDWHEHPRAKPFAHVELVDRVTGVVDGCYLGVRRARFAGTDALSMSVGPRARAWLADAPGRFVLGEGDRLANLKFFDAARAVGYDVLLVQVTLDPAVAAERRASRGWAPNPAWLAGRRTKVNNLVAAWDGPRLDVPGDGPVCTLARSLVDIVLR